MRPPQRVSVPYRPWFYMDPSHGLTMGCCPVRTQLHRDGGGVNFALQGSDYKAAVVEGRVGRMRIQRHRDTVSDNAEREWKRQCHVHCPDISEYLSLCLSQLPGSGFLLLYVFFRSEASATVYAFGRGTKVERGQKIYRARRTRAAEEGGGGAQNCPRRCAWVDASQLCQCISLGSMGRVYHGVQFSRGGSVRAPRCG